MVGWLGKECRAEVLQDKTKNVCRINKKRKHPIESKFNCSHLIPKRVNFVLLEERKLRDHNTL